VYRTGDCVAPRWLVDTVFDGHRLAREIDSPDPAVSLPILREHDCRVVRHVAKPVRIRRCPATAMPFGDEPGRLRRTADSSPRRKG
jgi:hypothetical protein